LNAAYASGLLSDETFVSRVDQVLRSRVVDPIAVVGDLNLRGAPGRWKLAWARLQATMPWPASRTDPGAPPPALLALDWNGGQGPLLLGRHGNCDVVLSDPTVSRRHARLVFRDPNWIVQDLESRNGTFVNRARVGRCELRPGDELLIGETALRID
jgi:hypothetical protein